MPERVAEFDYFYGYEAEQFSFYRVPKLLFTDTYFKNLSSDAKVLYGLMLDRMGLSIRNRWIDSENKVYIFFTVEEVMEYMNCGKNKAVQIMAELDTVKGIGLIEKKRQGMGKPSIIYVKNFISVARDYKIEKEFPPDGELDEQETKNEEETAQNQEVYFSNFKKFKNQTSRGLESKLQEVCFSNPNNTDINNTDMSDTKNLSYPSITDSGGMDGPMDRCDKRIVALEHVIKHNIEYESTCMRYPREDVDGICHLILEIMMCDRQEKLRIDGTEIPVELVKSQLMKLNAGHIEYVFDCLANKSRSGKIANIKKYLLTALYNAPATIGHYYTAAASYDWWNPPDSRLAGSG